MLKAGARDKLLLLEMEPVSIEVDDDWRNSHDDPPKLSLHFAVNVPSVVVLLSANTLPRLIRAAKDVQRLAQDQESKANTHLTNVGITLRPHSPVQRRQTISAMAQKLGNRSLTSHDGERNIELTDKLDISIGAARVYLFADSFEDTFHYRAELGENSKAGLSRTIDAEATSHRQLHLNIGQLGLYSQQYSRLPSKRPEESKLEDFLALFKSSSSSPTLLVPTPQVDMRSIQHADSNVVEHWFKLHVAGQVKIDQKVPLSSSPYWKA